MMTRQWSEIRTFYAGFDGDRFAAISGLVREIEQSRFASGLFPWTSMTTLCIAQTPADYPYGGPYLQIRTLTGGTQLEFRYVDTCRELEQWHRTVDGADGFHRLERFIEQLHWFAGE